MSKPHTSDENGCIIYIYICVYVVVRRSAKTILFYLTVLVLKAAHARYLVAREVVLKKLHILSISGLSH